MRNIKLTLEYDGSAFFGFQRQPDRPTVQEAFETALSTFLNRKTKIAAASGRTDAGVHAEEQVVNFKTESKLPVLKIRRALNSLLPKEIAVLRVEEAPPDFHARASARSKTYEYRIWNHPVRSPLRGRRAWHVPEPLNLSRMRSAAKLLTGRHDFRSFCAAGNKQETRTSKTGVILRAQPEESRSFASLRMTPVSLSVSNTIRTIKKFEILKEGPLLKIRVEADGFLYHMVRNLVGTLVEAGRAGADGRSPLLSPEEIRKILKARDRTLAPATAPARGLRLVRVNYGPRRK